MFQKILEFLYDFKMLIFEVFAVVVILVSVPHACQDKTGAEAALIKNGYTNVEAGGYAWMGCPRTTWWHTKFKAVKDNKEVTGCYCAGWNNVIVINEDGNN